MDALVSTWSVAGSTNWIAWFAILQGIHELVGFTRTDPINWSGINYASQAIVLVVVQASTASWIARYT